MSADADTNIAALHDQLRR